MLGHPDPLNFRKDAHSTTTTPLDQAPNAIRHLPEAIAALSSLRKSSFRDVMRSASSPHRRGVTTNPLWWQERNAPDNWDVALYGVYQQLGHKKWADEAYYSDRDRFGCTPLHIFAETNKHREAATLLSKHKADPNAESMHAMRPLHLAARHGNIGPVLNLIREGANPNALDVSGWSPLHYAACYGHAQCVRALLSGGAIVGSKDFLDNTPLHYAVEFCRTDVVKVLLQYEADPLSENRMSESPYSCAIEEGHNDILHLLRECMGTTTTALPSMQQQQPNPLPRRRSRDVKQREEVDVASILRALDVEVDAARRK